jgi:hypothetical protein
MKTAEFIPNMRCLYYHTVPSIYGDTSAICDCETLQQAKEKIKLSGIEQRMIVIQNGRIVKSFKNI